MAIIPLLTNVFDGDFTFPVEVEGSPLITTDAITKSKIITRTYAVLNSTYVPLSQGTLDLVYRDAYLEHEQPSSIQGPILFFQRVFTQLPLSRTESRTVSFTMPGASQAQFSGLTGNAIAWNQYAAASPGTYSVRATVQIFYSTSENFPTAPITVIRYNGRPVDFIGQVFTYAGNKTTQLSPTQSVLEPRWDFVGFTNPNILPIDWVLEVNVSRWRGIIYQYEVVTVRTSSL